MKTITKKQLIDLMSGINKSFDCEIIAETQPEHRKYTQEGILNPYYKNLIKRAKVAGIVNWIYQNEVNLQRIREGKIPDFEAEPRRWGDRLQNSPFVVYLKNRQKSPDFYLEMQIKKIKNLQYFYSEGKHKSRLDYDEIAPFLVPPNEPIKQQLDSPVILRDYNIKNIRTISFLGEVYKVKE